ncbi:cytochrome P450 [Kitasatospora sp. NPDC057904]|uniref:cytochrome P450 family protein n=1 Tax=unclassified Kitasatospora TaxID=2633591 RepID=UPI0036DE2FB9
MHTELDEEQTLDGPQHEADPHAFYERMREETPVRRVVFPGGLKVWLVTRYDDARAVLSDPRFSKDVENARKAIKNSTTSNAGIAALAMELVSHMLNSDPPDHTRLRGLVNKVFTARAVDRLKPGIETLAHQLLDTMADRPRADLMRDYAYPLPMGVLCELLGVPLPDREQVHHWAAAGNSNDPARVMQALPSLLAYLRELIDEKRRAPGEDLLTDLVRTSDDSGGLTPQELVSTTFLLMVAGHETTVNLIGNGTLALLRHPLQLEALRADRSLMPAAIEELLRYEGPVNTASLRYTTEPVEIGDVLIPAHHTVAVALTSANRDARQFPDPTRLDITRSTVGHVAFGHGIHYCVGARLARVEAEIAFTALLDRFPHLRPACDPDHLPWHGTMFHGLRSLPVHLTSARFSEDSGPHSPSRPHL